MSGKTCVEPRQPRAGQRNRRDYDTLATEKLTLQYLPLVKSIARRIFLSLPRNAAIDMNDLVQAGYVGLVNASRSYRSESQVPFATYARYRVRGEILDSLRKLDCASRNLRQWQKQVEAKSRDLATELQREPTDEEISEGLGVEIGRLREKKLALRSADAYSTAAGEEYDTSRSEPHGAPETRPDAMRSSDEMRQALATAIHSLPNRSREVIIMYYTAEMTMKEIGEKLSVNESRISQIHKGALAQMARTLKSSGISSSADL